MILTALHNHDKQVGTGAPFLSLTNKPRLRLHSPAGFRAGCADESECAVESMLATVSSSSLGMGSITDPPRRGLSRRLRLREPVPMDSLTKLCDTLLYPRVVRRILAPPKPITERA